MAMTTLVKDVLYRAGVLLKDLAPQFTRWTEREFVAWINEGQRAIAKYVPIAASRVLVIQLAPGTRQSIALIPAASVLPAGGGDVHGLFLNDVICNMGADGETPGDAISVVQREALDGASRGWRRERGVTALDHFMFDPNTPQTFEVYPPVAVGGTWIEAAIIVNPTDVAMPGVAGDYGKDSVDITKISLDDRWADDLLNYIMARAWMKDAEYAGNAQNVQHYTNLFINSINAQVNVLTGQNPNLKVLPLIPDVPAAAS